MNQNSWTLIVNEDDCSNLERTYRRKWNLVSVVLKWIRPIGLACVALGLVALAGYAFGLDMLYRPIPGGPASHPMTVLSVLLLGFVLSLYRPFVFSVWQETAVVMVISICLLRLLDFFFNTHYLAILTPFQSTLDSELLTGKHNAMGINTALMFLGYSLAVFFAVSGKHMLSQVIAFISMALPMLSIVGYLYDIPPMHGEMSLLTATVGMILFMGVINLKANRSVVKALMSPYIGGKTARMQIALGVMIPLFLGLLMVNLNLLTSNHFGLFVVGIIWFILTLVCFSAVQQEHIDLKRRQVEHRLSMMALYDPLTHLPNRRIFFDAGQRETARAKREKGHVWVLLIDLDFFKTINDTAGHAKGDQVLQLFTAKLINTIRTTDIAARVGGEEFAVILTNTSFEGAYRVAECIRENIASMYVPGWTHQYGPITVSIGCADTIKYASFAETLDAADKALYKAKETRNTVVMDPVRNKKPYLEVIG